MVFAVGVSFSWRCTWQSEARRGDNHNGSLRIAVIIVS